VNPGPRLPPVAFPVVATPLLLFALNTVPPLLFLLGLLPHLSATLATSPLFTNTFEFYLLLLYLLLLYLLLFYLLRPVAIDIFPPLSVSIDRLPFRTLLTRLSFPQDTLLYLTVALESQAIIPALIPVNPAPVIDAPVPVPVQISPIR
jgi:hypothetical protein